jgi:hypothetical protein
MPKRKALDAVQLAAVARTQSKAGVAEPPVKGGFKTSAVNSPVDVWELLRDAAFRRAKETGGRPSVSSLIAELVPENRHKLEAK